MNNVSFIQNIKYVIILTAVMMSAGCTNNWKQTELGITWNDERRVTELIFFSSKIVRVAKYPSSQPPEKKSLSVIKAAEKVELMISESAEEITIQSAHLEARLNKKTGEVAFYNLDGSLLLTEQNDGASFTSFDDAGKDTYTIRQTFSLDKDEAVYGLGQYMDGKMSKRNQEIFMRQDNKETVVPMLHSSKGYGLFWDNYSPTTYFDDSTQTYFESQVGDLIDYYFMYGESADGVIQQMRELTGQVPMFPKWTYGYWQSKERYKSQDETVGIVKKYRELGVPLDGIIQDWQYWGDNKHWNAMEFLNPAFPDPKKMIDDIHNLNAHIIISCWASFGPETKPFGELEEKGMLMDFTTWPEIAEDKWPITPEDERSGVQVYDAYHPQAREIYWNYLNEGIFSLGMDGWWLDSTEPDHLNIAEEDFDNQTFLGSFRSVRNAFPLMTVGGVSDHQRLTTNDKRVFILTRSAFAGQQRYGANSWSGDVITDWDVLRKQISAGLNFSLTGIPYWNSDIGGFFVWRFPGGVSNKAFHEIYVRWLQFGAFCPMMRSHGTNTPREIWQFGEKGSWAYDAIEKYINLRYRLIPYIYSTSWDVTTNGSSMMRALMMDFAKDKSALDVDNQYMFGESILVTPVTEPMYVSYQKEGDNYIDAIEKFGNTKSTQVYLPKGNEWFDFWSGEQHSGGQTIERETPIDIIPLYVKAGSIIPIGPKVQYTDEKTGSLEIWIYPGSDAEFVLYDDEGDNYSYENGKYATIVFHWNEAMKTLEIGDRTGLFEGMDSSLMFDVILVKDGQGFASGQIAEMKKVNYSGKELVINWEK
ncbi:MAG: glycoside hydrolase family 31 protein [Cyclobacteriaceae bacterium]